MTQLGCDVSNFQGELSPSLTTVWVAAGIQHVVVRASLERQSMIALARRQMLACQEAGLSVSGYGWYYQSVNPADWAQQTLDAYGDLGLARIWLDCEETSDVGTPAQVVAWIRAWLDHLHAAGVATGIYTGAGWWPKYTADSHDFTDEPLWTAQYDNVMDLNIGLTYGGWRHPYAAKQFADDGMVGGMKLDMDLFSDEVVIAGEDMGQVADLQNELAYLQGDVADAFEAAITTLEQTPRLPKAARDAVTGGLRPALETLRRGGPPADGD